MKGEAQNQADWEHGFGIENSHTSLAIMTNNTINKKKGKEKEDLMNKNEDACLNKDGTNRNCKNKNISRFMIKFECSFLRYYSDLFCGYWLDAANLLSNAYFKILKNISS